MRFLPASLAAGLLLAAAPAARAQSLELASENFMSSVISNQIVLAHANATGTTAALNNPDKVGRGLGARPATSTRAARLTYTPTVAARQAAVGAYARSRQAKSPALAAKAPQLFGPGGQLDYGPRYATLIQGAGLKENDVADAFTAYLVGTYQVAHGAVPGGGALVPAGPAAGVRAQYAAGVARALAGKPAATVAGLGEFLKLQTVLLSLGAQGNPAGLPALRQGVSARLKRLFRVDVNALTLTNQGFVQR